MKTEAAKAAQLIRKELKTTFPGVKFSVSSKNYSGGNSIDIDWNADLAVSLVNEIVKKYQYGHFDGMTDSYIYSNIKDFPQVKFIFASRRRG